MINQSDIARGFGRAFQYDDAARVQAQTAQLLRERLAEIYAARPAPRRILEIGSGTGLMTMALLDLFPYAELVATDLSWEMLRRCRDKCRTQHPARHVSYVAMDGERPGLGRDFDLICSNFCIQWFQNRRESLHRLQNFLNREGVMALSTLSEGSFKEWHAACVAACKQKTFGPWPSLAELKADFTSQTIGGWSTHSLSDAVGTARQFLRDIRRIGAAPSGFAGRPLQPRDLNRIMKFFDQSGSTMTYEVAIGIFETRGSGL